MTGDIYKQYERPSDEDKKPAAPADPFASLDTSELDKVREREEVAAKAQGLEPTEPELTTDVTLIPEDIGKKPKESWMRRDYTQYLEAWDQIAIAPDNTCLTYATESQARNARSEFYKARAQQKQSLGNTYPDLIESIAQFTISLRKARNKTSGCRIFILVFEKQAPVPEQLQSIEELQDVIEFEDD